MPTILLKDQTFNYTIKRKLIRSIRLHLTSKTNFSISCPYLTPNFIIENFVKKNSAWILKHAPKFYSHPHISRLKTITILDKSYKLIIIRKPRDSILISNKEQTIYLYSSLLTNSHLKKILEKYFKEFSLSLIKQNLQNLKQEFNFNYHRVSARNQKSRFGSCSHAGNLSFNWQIIFFPFPIFRHLLFHELTHLSIKNHSKNFWHQLSLYDPDYKKYNTWLKKEGNKHFLIKP